ncbi:olfactory receptor 10A7-like [Sphaerodactylus townsendi]|uniref:olfactory receptor 10A7-like n=1 Tax=Sphaerodactylus townsendi TaxID=933632 RepID=UPI002025E13F|nr:olfactory receptor 10A7-like [Sphaerodactylus townsendi]
MSLFACFTQLYLFGFLVTAETCLLSVMSYDRYLAICKPLQYHFHMNNKACISLAAGSWISGCFSVSVVVIWLSQLTYCGFNGIDHFYCDFVPLSKLACSDTYSVEILIFALSVVVLMLPFTFIVISYIHISRVVLRMCSGEGRQRAFSTCATHLIVVTLFYSTIGFTYLQPRSNRSADQEKRASVFYALVSPMLNPIIYSLRNKDVKGALAKVLRKFR